MNETIGQTLGDLINAIQAHIPLLVYFVGLFWAVHIVNILSRGWIKRFGIIPRTPFGLFGIFTSPFIHGDLMHLLVNTSMLIVLGGFMMIQGTGFFFLISAIIIVLGGLLLWCVGRRACHIGASSLIMGYWGALVMMAYKNPSVITIGIAAICIIYFGSMIFSVLPEDKAVSFEGHLCGLIAGGCSIFIAPIIGPKIYPLLDPIINVSNHLVLSHLI